MKRIIIASIFNNAPQFIDFLARFCHHFQFHESICLIVLVDPSFNYKQIDFNSDIDSLVPPDISRLLVENNFDIVYKQTKDVDIALSEIGNCQACLIYDENFYRKNHLCLKKITKKFYYCDPVKTRQEGSNFIQASLDLLPNKDKANNEKISLSKFIKFKSSIESKVFEQATILATGPSVSNFKEYDYTGSLNIYCNSTILDHELLKTAPPNILTFADPIFHFGVSEYASSFRSSCKKFLESYSDCVIIIPIKYYALALSLFPDYKERIIGIPFTKHKPINFEISEKNFYTYTTSNILTLSLLPVATTFAKRVRLIGCDGRKVSDDSYFWNHGSSVQINDKMKAIQKAHPGFFNIDYNEYYFEHCHNLSRMLLLAEEQGWKFSHLGPSFIPALESRAIISGTEQITKSVTDPQSEAFIIIEPDGLQKGDGHYEIWHRSLEKEAKARGLSTFVFHNKKSKLYSAKTDIAAFDNHSWAVGFYEREKLEDMLRDTPTYSTFVANLKDAFAELGDFSTHGAVSLYMYYGSIHHLQALIEFKKYFDAKKGAKLNINLTLSFEAIRFDDKRTYFWGDKNGHFKSILLESQYFFPSIKVFAMTDRFAKYVFKQYDILLPTLTHPILSTPPENHANQYNNLNVYKESHQPNILLIGRFTVGKFPSNYFDLLGYILMNSNVNLKLRNSLQHVKSIESLTSVFKNRVTLLPEKLSNHEYENAFQSTDIVLIPYLPANFLMRTSGILIDAVMNEKPVICFGQSTISDIVFKHKLGIYCNSYTQSSLLSAINLIYTNYNLYKNSVSRYKYYLIDNASFTKQINDCFDDSAKLLNEK